MESSFTRVIQIMETQKQFIVFIIEPMSKWIYNKTEFGGSYIRVNRGKKTMKCSIKIRTNVGRKANTRLQEYCPTTIYVYRFLKEFSSNLILIYTEAGEMLSNHKLNKWISINTLETYQNSFLPQYSSFLFFPLSISV